MNDKYSTETTTDVRYDERYENGSANRRLRLIAPSNVTGICYFLRAFALDSINFQDVKILNNVGLHEAKVTFSRLPQNLPCRSNNPKLLCPYSIALALHIEGENVPSNATRNSEYLPRVLIDTPIMADLETTNDSLLSRGLPRKHRQRRPSLMGGRFRKFKLL